jgi:hypothetical protein
MTKRTFKAIGCGDCLNKEDCKDRITGISRDKVYQSLANAKLYTFIGCPEDLHEQMFVEVKEEL